MHKFFSAVLFAATFILAAGCQAENGDKYQAGKHYIVLPQAVRTSDPSKIEVADVFWYGCTHCFKFKKQVEAWSETLADDVALVRNPAQLGRRVEFHTRAYYAAKALDKQGELHEKLFSAYHDKKLRLLKEKEIGGVFAEVGVEKDKFSEVFNSFGVISQSMQAESRSKGYRVTGTPCLVVNGKYRIDTESAGSLEEIITIADFLIEKERQARK